MPPLTPAARLNLARLLIGAVLLMNVQCAAAFLVAPQTYAPAYELTGAVGAATLRGIGLLFLMWNVPYAVALSHPLRRRVSLYEAIAMQTLGVAGESLIRWSLPPGHAVLSASLLRFIVFDAAGLLALLLAAWITRGAGRQAD